MWVVKPHPRGRFCQGCLPRHKRGHPASLMASQYSHECYVPGPGCVPHLGTASRAAKAMVGSTTFYLVELCVIRASHWCQACDFPGVLWLLETEPGMSLLCGQIVAPARRDHLHLPGQGGAPACHWPQGTARVPGGWQQRGQEGTRDRKPEGRSFPNQENIGGANYEKCLHLPGPCQGSS